MSGGQWFNRKPGVERRGLGRVSSTLGLGRQVQILAVDAVVPSNEILQEIDGSPPLWMVWKSTMRRVAVNAAMAIARPDVEAWPTKPSTGSAAVAYLKRFNIIYECNGWCLPVTTSSDGKKHHAKQNR